MGPARPDRGVGGRTLRGGGGRRGTHDLLLRRCLCPEPAAICPNCRSAEPAWPGEAVDAWTATGAADLGCAACAHRAPLPQWEWTDDSLAFAHLGFEFDDWPPLHPDFTAALGRTLGHHTRLFERKI
ncbi:MULTISPECIES: hypothetical protein [unclassified Streptomyces]|uniref:hypothetical protein n=1 Tax=unclassified Streptomyces TaxID=2593676 RepID=UPI000F73B520|nr:MULTISPECIES: hypothetical protein [unclassified Streptomyces]QNE24299.1 hypothetical protein F1D59_05545 [Streptomyces sp. INR7]RSS84844.1 hypothetical protein EF904_37115 [Streptomyces sp. WAC05950]